MKTKMDINYEVEHLENILEKYYINNYDFEKDKFNEDVINKDNPEEYISLLDFDEYFPKTIYVKYTDDNAYLSLEWSINNNQWVLGYRFEKTNKWYINVFVDNIENIKNGLSELLNKIKE